MSLNVYTYLCASDMGGGERRVLHVHGDAPSAIIVLWMLFAALAVSAGAVFGRYHYATDALTGWIVAASVWLAAG